MREYGIQYRLGPGFQWNMADICTYSSLESATDALSYHQRERTKTSREFRVVSRAVDLWVVE